jgi:hypothetical protein
VSQRSEFEQLAVFGHKRNGYRRTKLGARQRAVVHRLEMDGDRNRYAHGYLRHIGSSHADRAAADETRRTRVDDRDPRPPTAQPLDHLLAPNAVRADIEVTEHKAAHGSERRFDGRVERVTSAGTRHANALPVQLVLDRSRVEAQLPQPLGIGRLTKDGHVARQQPLARRIEVVAMQVSDKDSVEPFNEPLSWHGQRQKRVPKQGLGVLDRRPCAGVVERRIDEQPSPFDFEKQRRVTDERQPDRPHVYRPYRYR